MPKLKKAVSRLHNGRATGPSKMKAEDLKQWLREAFRDGEEEPRRDRWDNLVTLVQHCWTSGELPKELSWTFLALLPKGQADHRGIGLIEIVWKLLEAIIDTRVKKVVSFHDILHGFQGRYPGSQAGTGVGQVPLLLIFLDLRKAYDTVDREEAMTTMEEYGVGPNARRLLQAFWDSQKLVARVEGFHGRSFDATRGCTQGSLFSPQLFNMMSDKVIRHWLRQQINDDGIVNNSFGLTVAQRISCFYADDGAVGGRDFQWLQGAMDLLVATFRRIGLAANATKTQAMTCLPGFIPTRMSEAAYNRMVTGEGPSYRQRLRHRVPCPGCGKEVAMGSMTQHRWRMHGLEPEVNWNLLNVQGAEHPPHTYEVSMPQPGAQVLCPVEECRAQPTSLRAMQQHFNKRHWNDRVHILEDGGAPYPSCERCGMQLAPSTSIVEHHNSKTCREGVVRKHRRELELAAYRSNEVEFTLNGVPLTKVTQFLYLGRPLAYNNSDWPALYRNLKKARVKWGMLSRLLERNGVPPKARGMFYQAVVQSVLLYGCETWTINDQMMKVLEGFHHARRMTGRRARLEADRTWFYPPLKDALESCLAPHEGICKTPTGHHPSGDCNPPHLSALLGGRCSAPI